ncbi:MAG: SIMPL domain-containing protein [Flavobacteriia bacterium]|nr:SIMPL domain-containing protein [Flavobacteriia bacterium]
MEFLKSNFKSLIITLAVVITGYILGNSYLSKGKADPTISVTGLGEASFDSDLIVWRADFSRKNMSLKEAYNELNKDLKLVKEYLSKKGIEASDIVIEAASIQKDYSNEYDEIGNIRSSLFSGYNLTQNMIIQSKNVNLVEKTSREVSELIDAGIELNSNAPQYYYTKLAALKLSMIEQATKDAYNRAMKIAESGGGSLGNMKSADMGVFQITGENSSEDFEWGGSFNTSSKRKTANITMRLKYEID